MHYKFFSIISFISAIFISFGLMSCTDDDDSVWSEYKDWREFNQEWLLQQTTRTNPDGTAYYTRCYMPTDPQAYVLMHTFGEVNTTNLKPLFTSTTKVNYTLKIANDSIVDKGSDFISQLNLQSWITGWSLAIMQLHVGDTAQFTIPYNIGYGATGASNIKPDSNLQFNIRLLDIVNYETRP